MPTIAPVRVNLEAVDRVSRPVRAVMSTLGNLKSRTGSVLGVVGKLAAGFAAVGVAAAVAATKLFTSFVERAGEINDAAKRIGISAETLQELRHSAEQAGVSTEVLGKALQKYLLRPGAKIEDVTGGIAERFSQLTDAGDKLRFSRALFGKGGAAMVPWLDEGAGVIAAQMQEARDLGLVINNEATAGADELGDRFGTLTKAARGIGDAVSASITPDVLAAVNQLILFLAKNRESVVKDLTAFARDLLEGAKALVMAIPDLKPIAADFAAFAKGVGPMLGHANELGSGLNSLMPDPNAKPWIDLPALARRGAKFFDDAGARVELHLTSDANSKIEVKKLKSGIPVSIHQGPHGVGGGSW